MIPAEIFPNLYKKFLLLNKHALIDAMMDIQRTGQKPLKHVKLVIIDVVTAFNKIKKVISINACLVLSHFLSTMILS